MVEAARSGEPDVTSETEKPEKTKRRRRFGRVASRKWSSGRRTWRATWFCRVERHRMSRSFDTEKEAKDFLAELERRVITATYEIPPTVQEAARRDAEAAVVEKPKEVPFLCEYAAQVIERRYEPVLAAGTLGMYRAALRAWTGFFGAKEGHPARRLHEVTPALWSDYRAWRSGTRHSICGTRTSVGPRTLNADQQCMVRILNEAVADGHLERNPLAGTRKLREPRKPRRWLSKEELALLIEKSSKGFRPLVVAAVTTGARKSELTRLKWSDIDFRAGKIALFRSKTGSSDSIDLHPMLARELLALRARRKKRKDVADGDAIFLSRRGGAYTNVARSWRLAIEAAGLAGREGLTFHSLRHSFAVHALENGASVTDLQSQLGHANLATTQIYAASVNERRRAMVMALDFAPRAETKAGSKPRIAKARWAS